MLLLVMASGWCLCSRRSGCSLPRDRQVCRCDSADGPLRRENGDSVRAEGGRASAWRPVVPLAPLASAGGGYLRRLWPQVERRGCVMKRHRRRASLQPQLGMSALPPGPRRMSRRASRWARAPLRFELTGSTVGGDAAPAAAAPLAPGPAWAPWARARPRPMTPTSDGAASHAWRRGP